MGPRILPNSSIDKVAGLASDVEKSHQLWMEECRWAASVECAEQEEKGPNGGNDLSAREGSSGMHDDSTNQQPEIGLHGIDEEQNESSGGVEIIETAAEKECQMKQSTPGSFIRKGSRGGIL